MGQKTIVILAGANGSGKSSTVEEIESRMDITYLCADDIALQLREKDKSLSEEQLALKAWEIVNRKKYEFLNKGESFIYETVFSHPSNLEFIKYAKKHNYRVIYIYIGTNSPRINIKRVAKRVSDGGHNVNRNKIVKRYYRSMRLIKPTLKLVDFAYILDNSVEEGQAMVCAVKTDAELLIINNRCRWIRAYCM